MTRVGMLMTKSFLLSFVGLVSILGSLARAESNPDSVEAARVVPIADVHMHAYIKNGPKAEDVLAQMDKNGIRWGGAVGDYRADVASLLGTRYIPALGQAEFMKVFFSQGESGLIDATHPVFVRLFDDAEKQLARGTAGGFGELHTDNHASGPQRMRRHIRTDNPVMRQFFSLANKYGGFVQIHSQQDEKFNEDILRLTAEFPKTKAILSHCLPIAKPDDLARLFVARENIFCELSAQGEIHPKLSGQTRPARVFSDNGIRADWQVLIERFPDRIMIGTDACCGWFDAYSDMVAEIRRNLLSHLAPEVMEKIAYKNAVRVFQLK